MCLTIEQTVARKKTNANMRNVVVKNTRRFDNEKVAYHECEGMLRQKLSSVFLIKSIFEMRHL